ncbi:steroid delta-5-3-ketosteroid isomerase [Richelia intracellularis]|nr:steroid delta-5-3-ketosteroid isomerase [Richelia intracellularis]
MAALDAISFDRVGEPPSKVHEGFQDFIGLLQASYKTLEAKTEHIFIAGNEYMLLSGKW